MRWTPFPLEPEKVMGKRVIRVLNGLQIDHLPGNWIFTGPFLAESINIALVNLIPR
jgi:hypothetical protein